MISINREKAEQIAIGSLRVIRDAELAKLDIDYVRALESGNDTTEILAFKNRLRDVTSKDLSKLTFDELSALTLDRALCL